MKILTLGIIIAMVLTPSMAIFNSDILSFNDDTNSNEIILDSEPPRSTLESAPNIVFWPTNIYSRPTAFVKWFGADDIRGTGIQNFDVQYKKQYIGNNLYPAVLPEWQDWLTQTENTSATLFLDLDFVYYFRCRARDFENNVEEWPHTWDAVTVAKGVAPRTYSDLQEILMEKKEDRKDDDEKIRSRPQPKDEIPPESRVKKLFPFHILISPLCYPANSDRVSIMVYPYPPSYYLIDWLEEAGIISQANDYGTIPISWTSKDNPGGLGVESLDVQYRNPHPVLTFKEEPDRLPIAREWTDIITETEENETKFKVYEAGLYQFRCRARDIAGNEEDYPVQADTSVLVIDLRCYCC